MKIQHYLIRHLILKNFKCFEELDIPMSNLNVFSGINSMGKSTAIQALLLLRQSYDMGNACNGIHLNGDMVNIGIGQDLLYKGSTKDVIGIGLDLGGYRLDWTYEYHPKNEFLNVVELSVDENDLKKVNLFTPAFAYVSAERLGPRRIYEKSPHHGLEKNPVGYKGEYFVDYLENYGVINKVENPHILLKGYDEKILYQMGAWLSVISPGIRLATESYSEAGLIRMTYKTFDNALESYSPLNVGFGLSYTAPVILTLLTARNGDLVILENPEAHLHPLGQRKMGELIAKAAMGGIQIIVETHSDHLLNGIRLAVKKNEINEELVRLHYFYAEKINGQFKHLRVSPEILKDGRLSSWPKGFFDEWDNALMELL